MDFATITFLVPLLSWLSCFSCHQTKLTTLGLFSTCEKEISNEDGMYRCNTESLIYQRLVKSMFDRDCMTPKDKYCTNFTENVHYEEYDVCYDHEKMYEILLNINFKSSYFMNSDINEVFTVEHSTVFLLITFITMDLQKIVASLSMTVGYPITIILNPDVQLSLPLRWRSIYYADVYATKISRYALLHMFMRGGWQKAGIFLLAPGGRESIFTQMYYDLLDDFKRVGGICFYNITLEPKNVVEYKRIIDAVQKADSDYPRIPFGERDDQLDFIRKVEYDASFDVRLFWIVHDLMTTIHAKKSMNLISLSRAPYIQAWRVIRDYGSLVHPGLKSISPNTSVKLEATYNAAVLTVYHMKQVSGSISNMFARREFKRDTTLNGFTVSLKAFLWTNAICLTELQDNLIMSYKGDISDYDIIFNHIFYKVNRCMKLPCKAGYYTDFGAINWTHDGFCSYGWTCRPCKRKHIKNFTGHGLCTVCPLWFVSNYKGTDCFDPYMVWYSNLDMLEIKLCLCLALAAIVASLGTFCLLVFYRKTPIVLAMDFRISLLHFLIILFITTVSIACFIGKPKKWRCLMQLMVYVLHSITVSITLMRSQKIFEMFNSKVKLEKQGLIFVSLKQSGVVIINSLVAAAILIISLHAEPIDVISTMYPEALERRLHCRGSFHVLLQVCLQIVLHIACFIPAFRCRNLPAVYNDAIAIVYLSFTAVIVYLVMFPIEYFQKDPISKSVVHWLFYLGNTLIHLVAYYGGKVYLILFKPDRNTKDYFRKQTMEAAQQKVNKLQAKKISSQGLVINKTECVNSTNFARY